jgi:MPBQ/MSBQ methyltransferase
MLFPETQEYRGWFEAAGFADVTLTAVAPDWYRDRRVPYAVAVSGVKPRPGPSPLRLAPPGEDVRAPLGPLARVRVAARFAAGSLAGFAFIPIALAMTLRARWERR